MRRLLCTRSVSMSTDQKRNASFRGEPDFLLLHQPNLTFSSSSSLIFCDISCTMVLFLVFLQVMVSQYNGAGKLEFVGRKPVSVIQHSKCKCDCIVQAKVRTMKTNETVLVPWFRPVSHHRLAAASKMFLIFFFLILIFIYKQKRKCLKYSGDLPKVLHRRSCYQEALD